MPPFSEAGSEKTTFSRHSKGSYKAKPSYVDENLFGHDRENKPAPKVIPRDEMKKIRKEAEKGSKPDAVIISEADLKRIKNSTTIKTKEQLKEEQRLHKEQRDQQMAAAKAKKDRIIKFNKERESKLPVSETQKEQSKKKETLVSKAMEQLDEEHDDVKHMNQMMLYSKCVTIRDKQLMEKQRIEDERFEEQKRLDKMMEIERLKMLKYHEEREKKTKEDQLKGSLIIINQIKEREQARMREQEIQEKEKQQMLAQIEKLQKEEQMVAQRKRDEARRLMQEVEVSNRESTHLKVLERQKEKDEDERINEYNRQRILKEEAAHQEALRLQAEREKEIQHLRDMQEKAADRQSELDALKAKRHQEELERNERLRLQKEEEQRLKIMRDLEHARIEQAREKEMRMAEQAKQERDEFLRIIEKQKEEQENERRIEEEKKKVRLEHADKIRAQIQANEELKRQQRLDYLEEGRKVRQKQEDEKKKLEEIKKKKIYNLQDLGVPDKYQAELNRKKIS